MVKTKILATLGPSTSSYSTIRKMMVNGLDAVRLNFSHGSHESHLDKMVIVRDLNKKYRRHLRIVGDLEGFRIRIGFLKKEIPLTKKQKINLTPHEKLLSNDTILIDYEHDLSLIKKDQLVYIDDGNIILKVKQSTKKMIKCEVVEGDVLKSRKGINMPGVKFPFSGLTEKDKKDIVFAAEHNVDYLCQSFVRRPKDVEMVKKLIKKTGKDIKVIAKIETQEAIRNIDKLIDLADGIMVARGDMGIAIPIYQVAIIQKMIIKKCNKKKKMVITATQMLEHMTEHSRPTRAEVSDVTNSILDGTDYVMLSGESAAGKYPVETVTMMNSIIKYTEANK